MRYIILALLVLFSVILNGSLLSSLPFLGIQADIIILAVLSLCLAERSAMPIVFAFAAGLLTDILYSPIIGFFGLGYTVTAGVACIVLSKFERINILTVLITGLAGELLFEMICTVEAYISGARFSWLLLLKDHVLPQILFTSGALLLAYQLISKMMSTAYMKPKVKGKTTERSYTTEFTGSRSDW